MAAIILVSGLISILALGSAAYYNRYVVRQPRGTERMQEIQSYIRNGAITFMVEEAKHMSIAIVVIGAVLWALFYWEVAVSFWIGALFSMAAGFIGMNAATLSNAPTTEATRHSLARGLRVAFSGGSVMGLSVAGLAILGLVIVISLFRREFDPQTVHIQTKYLFGLKSAGVNFIKGALLVSAYSAGASLVALFDRVGGGIYTKAADMAADIVGKVEAKIPEDDPRNPATIADNVGDNVGDVGGLGADLLESFIGSIISVIVMALYIYVGRNNPGIGDILAKFGLSPEMGTSHYWWLVLMPLLIVAAGTLASWLGGLYIRNYRGEDPQRALSNGLVISAGLTAVFALVISLVAPTNLTPFWTVLLGLIAGVAIGKLSEYYTSYKYKPTLDLAEMNQAGPGVGVAGGLAVGMLSTFWPVLVLVAATVIAYQIGNLLGVAFTAAGMLSFVAMNVSIDSYGPVADNAGGIATMAELPREVRHRTDQLDAVGNTTAAIGKGFAIGSAAFAALGLIASYLWSAIGSANQVLPPQVPLIGRIAPQLSPTGSWIDVGPWVISGLMVGAMLPYVFSAILIRGVTRTADLLVLEIRRQFKENPKILTGEAVADYKRCISITASGALKNMTLPAVIAVVTPLFVGLVFGRYALAGVLFGGLLSAIQLAIFCANSGGAMDNAKKYIELGHFGGEGSEAHAASVVGDTVGDPLKDTVGPSLDILIKLMSVISLVFASLFPVKPIFM